MNEIRTALSKIGVHMNDWAEIDENDFSSTTNTKYSLNNRLIIQQYPDGLRIFHNKHPLEFERKSHKDVGLRYSDYGKCKAAHFIGYYPDNIPLALASIARTNRRDKLFSCAVLPPNYIEAKKAFIKIIDDPNIELSDEFCDIQMREYLMNVSNLFGARDIKCIDSVWDCRRYAEYFPEYQKIVYEYIKNNKYSECFFSNYPPLRSFLDRVVPILIERVKKNCAQWKEDFRGLRWRTVNPGSQHTSSINPIIEDPRNFYVNCYRPFYIGITNNTELAIRLVLKKYKVPNDLKKAMIRQIIWTMMIDNDH
jgi:hypothetical protein